MLEPVYLSLIPVNLNFSKKKPKEDTAPQKKGIRPDKPKIKAELGIFFTLVLLELLAL